LRRIFCQVFAINFLGREVINLM